MPTICEGGAGRCMGVGFFLGKIIGEVLKRKYDVNLGQVGCSWVMGLHHFNSLPEGVIDERI